MLIYYNDLHMTIVPFPKPDAGITFPHKRCWWRTGSQPRGRVVEVDEGVAATVLHVCSTSKSLHTYGEDEDSRAPSQQSSGSRKLDRSTRTRRMDLKRNNLKLAGALCENPVEVERERDGQLCVFARKLCVK